MSYSDIPSNLIGAGKALLPSLFSYVSDNFTSHESRIGVLESTVTTIPPGVILERPTSVIPSGYLACDGSAVSRGTYSNLFAVTGTTFGVGDGSTTFNVPDLRGRLPIGSGTGSGLTARSLGATTGVETHTLIEAELAVHTHIKTDPGHAHKYPHTHTGFGAGASAFNLFNNSSPGTPNKSNSGSVTNGTTAGLTLQNTGGGGAHANIQPSVVCAFMIKT